MAEWEGWKFSSEAEQEKVLLVRCQEAIFLFGEKAEKSRESFREASATGRKVWKGKVLASVGGRGECGVRAV